jgi:hypothetical protein
MRVALGKGNADQISFAGDVAQMLCQLVSLLLIQVGGARHPNCPVLAFHLSGQGSEEGVKKLMNAEEEKLSRILKAVEQFLFFSS